MLNSGGRPGLQAERILNSGESAVVRWEWTWRGLEKGSLEPHPDPISQDFGSATTNIHLVIT